MHLHLKCSHAAKYCPSRQGRGHLCPGVITWTEPPKGNQRSQNLDMSTTAGKNSPGTGKGFAGPKKQQSAPGARTEIPKEARTSTGGIDKAVQRALALSEAQPTDHSASAAAGARGAQQLQEGDAAHVLGELRARPVDAQEAARGKLDIVQVSSWGDGTSAGLGDLRVTRHRASRVQADASTPLYDTLLAALQLVESRGCLAVAGPAPPPLEKWSFSPTRYAQHLADMAVVHEALDTALHQAEQAAAAAGEGQQQQQQVEGSCRPNPLSALLLLGASSGLQRGQAIQHDMQAFCDSFRQEQAMDEGGEAAHNGGESPQQAVQQPGAVSSAGAGGVSGAACGPALRLVGAPRPGAMAVSYASHITRLGKQAAAVTPHRTAQHTAPTAAAAAAAAGGVVPVVLSASDRAACQLLAHAVVLSWLWQAGGVRLGAVAVEKLGLFARRAAGMYFDYPPQVSDPRARLREIVDAAGMYILFPASSSAASPAPEAAAAAASETVPPPGDASTSFASTLAAIPSPSSAASGPAPLTPASTACLDVIEDELASAMQKASLALMAALAHTN